MTKFIPVKLAYDVYKPSNGNESNLPPVIYMHGITGSKENFDNFPQLIADETGRKGYAYDARNHGDSEQTDIFEFDLLADDLFHFMDTMEIPKAVLVGSSMGGMTAIKAALRKPERVEMVFIEDMFTKKCPKEIADAVCGFIQLWLTSVSTIPKDLDRTEAIKHAVDFMYSKIPPGTPYLSDKEKLYNAGFVFNRSIDGSYDVKFNKKVILNALMKFDEMAEPTGEFTGPAYFIYGSNSPFCVGKEEENIKKHFPKAELIEFAGAHHNVHMEFPEKFVDTILQRLKL